MITTTVREFLETPRIARFSTIDSAGYPHTVPVWFDLDGDDIVVISVSDTRKVGYLRVNPKAAVAIGGDTEDGAGYLVKGEVSIETDPDDAWVKKLVYRYETPEQAEKDIADWAELDIIVLRLRPAKVIKVM